MPKTTGWLNNAGAVLLKKGSYKVMIVSLIKNTFLWLLSATVLIVLSACGGGGGGSATSFSVSGTITPVSGSRVDSDVNNPDDAFAFNNDFNSAQLIPNPVSLGGYVSLSPTNAAGDRFANQSDLKDYFSVQLAAGQVISLTNVNIDMDLDLYLWDENQNLVESSLNVKGNNEGLTVPGAFTGTQNFFIEVRAALGSNGVSASIYVLTIGLASQSFQNSGYQLSSDFVPGEIIVSFNKSNTNKNLQAKAGDVGLTALAGASGRDMLMRIDTKAQVANVMKTLNMSEAVKSVDAIKQKKLDTLLALKSLYQRDDVKQVRLNYIYKSLATPNDTNYSVQWNLPLINLQQAWDVTTGSSNVIVAVIDTGVNLSHPDLAGKLVQGFDFIRDVTAAADGNGIDNNPDDPGDNIAGFSSSFHGTHVAGTVGAATNNGKGVAGVGWNTRIMPLRVLGVGGVGNSYDIEQAVRYAAGLANDSNTFPAQKADVINLSLGGSSPNTTGQLLPTPQAYIDARNAGVIVVAAAGNDSSSTPLYPASYDGVVSVGAVDLSKRLAPYSNFGIYIDVVAPGGDASRNINGDSYPDGILSTLASDSGSSVTSTYGIKQGTSMAAPHVAGVAALMKAVNSSMSPDDFDMALSSGGITEDLGITGFDSQFGFGLIDALKAVLIAQGGVIPDNPFLAVSPGSINFGSTGTVATLGIRNAGTGILNAINVSENSGGWLTVTENTVDADKLGTYTLTVNRDNLAEGTYIADITISSSVNTVTIPVILQKITIVTFDDAGTHYVLLYDPSKPPATAVVAQTRATLVNGLYQFNIDNITPGDYQFFAGTDLDNDGFICGTGEACGIYPDSSPDQATFTVDSSNITNVNFVTGFGINLTGSALSLDKPKLLPVIKKLTF
ncbi:MAG: S8 family serine peptidase [Gammaproteobacteria bacterium]|nr:S8 family serine peptidase [Gammaproteobacteria bacterium]